MSISTHIRELQDSGFTKLPGVVSASRAEAILAKIESYRHAALRDSEVRVAVSSRKRQRVGGLLLRDDEFCQLLINEFVLSISRQILSDGLICSSWSSHTLLPGFETIAWHRDYPHWNYDAVGGPVLSLQVFWMLDKFTKVNGATRFIPSSHRQLIIPEVNRDFAGGRTICGEPGDVVIADARVLHTAMPNESAHPRTCLLASFVRPFVMPMEDMEKQIRLAGRQFPGLKQLYHAAIRSPVDISF